MHSYYFFPAVRNTTFTFHSSNSHMPPPNGLGIALHESQSPIYPLKHACLLATQISNNPSIYKATIPTDWHVVSLAISKFCQWLCFVRHGWSHCCKSLRNVRLALSSSPVWTHMTTALNALDLTTKLTPLTSHHPALSAEPFIWWDGSSKWQLMLQLPTISIVLCHCCSSLQLQWFHHLSVPFSSDCWEHNAFSLPWPPIDDDHFCKLCKANTAPTTSPEAWSVLQQI